MTGHSVTLQAFTGWGTVNRKNAEERSDVVPQRIGMVLADSPGFRAQLHPLAVCVTLGLWKVTQQGSRL